MRMVLHGVSDDVCDLIVSSVVHLLHGMEYAPLHRFQSVVDMWDSTLQDNVARIVEEPVLVHPRQMVHGGGIEPVGGLVVAVLVDGKLVLTVGDAAAFADGIAVSITVGTLRFLLFRFFCFFGSLFLIYIFVLVFNIVVHSG